MEVEVLGKGSVLVKMVGGVQKLIHDIKYVPSLDHNLLSIGQLTSSGYKVVFSKNVCRIFQENIRDQFLVIQKNNNNLYSMEFSSLDQVNVVIKGEDISLLQHKRFGYLNFQGLQYLNQQEQVVGLPSVKKISLCEDCVYGKQA